MKRRALISVTEKEGLIPLARALSQSNFEIVATAGTYSALKSEGLEVLEISEVTCTKELAGGRVKSLHPAIFAGILASGKERGELEAEGIAPIDIVVVNLYRFSDSESVSGQVDDQEKVDVEKIDVGGVALIRAAAKNFEDVTLLTNPTHYQELIDALPLGLDEQRRRELAAIGFALTARYDLAIARAMAAGTSMPLRYGENPHQPAVLLSDGSGVAGARIISSGSKALSYNNYLDADAAWRAVHDHPARFAVAAIVKHTNPCGIARGESVRAAFRRALESDPASSFGGIVAFNRTVDEDVAKDLAEIFLEVIVAPSFTDGARAILAKRESLRLMEVTDSPVSASGAFISGGILLQEPDLIAQESSDDWELVCGQPLEEARLEDLRFAWASVRSVKSNAIVIAKDGATIGIGMGQVSRVDAARLAVSRGSDRVKGSVAASDAFFPFADGAMELIEAGVVAIVQPGGSKRDNEVIEAVSAAGVTMYFTHRRHFSH